MKEDSPDIDSYIEEIAQTEHWKRLKEAVAELARTDATIHMDSFFQQNQFIPIQPGYQAPEEIIKKTASRLNGKVGILDMTEAEYKIYRDAFLEQCSLGYPIRIN